RLRVPAAERERADLEVAGVLLVGRLALDALELEKHLARAVVEAELHGREQLARGTGQAGRAGWSLAADRAGRALRSGRAGLVPADRALVGQARCFLVGLASRELRRLARVDHPQLPVAKGCARLGQVAAGDRAVVGGDRRDCDRSPGAERRGRRQRELRCSSEAQPALCLLCYPARLMLAHRPPAGREFEPDGLAVLLRQPNQTGRTAVNLSRRTL